MYSSNSSSDYQLELRRFLNSGENNNRCSDCRATNPTWCSTSYNVFLCTRCATLHKKILNKEPYVSHIKSITRDFWRDDELYDFLHHPNNLINRNLSTTSDSAYDIEELIQAKYLRPVLKNDTSSLSGANARFQKKYPLLSNRMARDYELSKYSRHIREIEARTKHQNIDKICEALSLTRGNISNAIDILNYNSNFKSHSYREASPPSLPERPTTEPKQAIFHGQETHHEPKPALFDGSTNYVPPQPKPAVFDGTNDLNTVDYNSTIPNGHINMMQMQSTSSTGQYLMQPQQYMQQQVTPQSIQYQQQQAPPQDIQYQQQTVPQSIQYQQQQLYSYPQANFQQQQQQQQQQQLQQAAWVQQQNFQPGQF